MKIIIALFLAAVASPALAECANGYSQITVPICQQNAANGIIAVPANTFLNSLGVNTHIDQGYPEQPYEAEFTYTGIRHARDGSAASDVALYTALHNNTVSSTYPGVTVILGTEVPPSNQVSHGVSLANAGALYAFEGPNEPNNFLLTYNGQTGGGNGTWVPIANFQKDLYAAVKADSTARNYPVYGVSETGAETDNVGIQCGVLNGSCPGAASVTLMPQGTSFWDYANAHNYIIGVCQPASC